MKSYEASLIDYADAVVRTGLGPVEGRRIVIWQAPVEAHDFVRLLTERAYRAGAREVEPIWLSDAVLRARLDEIDHDDSTEIPTGHVAQLVECARNGDLVIRVPISSPEILPEQDPMSEYVAPVEEMIRRLSVAWTAVSIPTDSWARKVYPELAPSVALRTLWDDLLAFCRVADGGMDLPWEAHLAELSARKAYLTSREYRELRFEGPGTELVVGLPDSHVWGGGPASTPAGGLFAPNLPTEEVHTSPHRDKVDGTITASRSFQLRGRSIEGLSLRYHGGRLTEFSAQRGLEVVEEILSADDGASFLGEVALASADNPIARKGRLYFNPIIDENAGAHVALGRGFPYCVAGGSEVSNRELLEIGVNQSRVHTDIMIGSSDLDVTGVTPEGRLEPLLRYGRWAFAVEGQTPRLERMTTKYRTPR